MSRAIAMGSAGVAIVDPWSKERRYVRKEVPIASSSTLPGQVDI